MTNTHIAALRSHHMWLGSYKKSGEMVRTHVWCTVRDGKIEFVTDGASFKVKRMRRNPSVICYLGKADGPSVSGQAEIVTNAEDQWRVYRAYWKTHPLTMIFLALTVRSRIKAGTHVMVRIAPSGENPLAGVTDPKV